MKQLFFRLLGAVFLIAALGALTVNAQQQDAPDLTKDVQVTGSGYEEFAFLTDGKVGGYRTSDETAELTFTCDTPMAGLYIHFDTEYGTYTVTDNGSGKIYTAGGQDFLHEYIDLSAAFGSCPSSVTLEFASGPVRLSEIAVYGQGRLPDSVQRWDAPLDGGADLVLFSAHGDDEHLFFAGLLPYYSRERGYKVQVVYLTDHRNYGNSRCHEMLDGLWNVGITAYPVFGRFADFRIDNLAQSYDHYETKYGVTRDDLLEFVITQVRRFRPLVAVGHDVYGEYGHGMHRIYADLLMQATTDANNPDIFPASAQTYGPWQMQKVYLHLYKENPIVMDYDQPLDAFGGMTAFEVSQQIGFPSHVSQTWTMFTEWINGAEGEAPITKASQIKTNNPCKFGLFYSAVGEDVEKNDFFEHVLSYDQQYQLEQERLEQERLEQERLEKEEQERLEQARQEQARLEEEQLQKVRQEQALKEQQRQEAARKKKLTLWIVGFVLLVAVGGGSFLLSRKKPE